MRRDKVYIVGVAPDGSLPTEGQGLLAKADLVLGGRRLLDLFPSVKAEKVSIGNNLEEVVDRVREDLGNKRIAVLASGDPGFFGIARTLVEKLGAGKVEILPNVSSIQLAFARIKQSWDDATLLSAHARPTEEVIEAVRAAGKVAILTDPTNTPQAIATALLEHGIVKGKAFVCQDLGTSQERIASGSLARVAKGKYSPLSVLVLLKSAESAPALLGTPDESFRRKKAITKLEVRAISLAKLALTGRSIMWDIGAGSGAMSIEASCLASRGHVYAIEKNAEAIANIKRNLKRFGRHNISVVQAMAPEGLAGRPDPDAIFVGGSGGNLAAILDVSCQRLKPGGRIVINAATLENMNGAMAGLKKHGFTAEVTLVSIARGRDIAGLTRLEPVNPVFVITGKRSSNG